MNKMADDSSLSDASPTSFSGSDSEAILDCESDSEVDLVHNENREGLKPYMFEPEDSSVSSDSSTSTSSSEGPRTRNNDWCQCEFCQRQDTERECVCCKELPKVMDKNVTSSSRRQIAEPSCITLNPGFLAV